MVFFTLSGSIGIPAYLWFMRGEGCGLSDGEAVSVLVFLLLLYLMSVICLFVGIKGCDSCLSKFSGGGGISEEIIEYFRSRKNRP